MFLYKIVVCEKYGLYWYFKKANLLPNYKYYMGNVKDTIKKLISTLGRKFSKELGIDLSKGKSTEIFKWFLASKLFGARIGTNIAVKTYREFEKCGVLSPKKILETGWGGLVRILDDGGDAPDDFSTATKPMEIK